MLYSGAYASGLSFYITYAEDSTEANPIVIAKGVDEEGNEFEQTISLDNIDPSDATIVEMRALEAHYKVDKLCGCTSLPIDVGDMGLTDRRNFLSMFEKEVHDAKILWKYDLVNFYMKNLQAYSDIAKKNINKLF